MLALAVALIAAISLAIFIGAKIVRQPSRPTTPPANPSNPRRQPQLEDRLRPAFDGPRAKHGDLFVSYTIWRRDRDTRLELFAADPFAQLNEFTRCLIVRHLWRALEVLAEGSVVIVDSPPQTWSRSVDERFHDHGIDPWRIAPALGSMTAPQYAKE